MNVIYLGGGVRCLIADRLFCAFLDQGDCCNSFFGLESRGATEGLLVESGPNSKNTPVRHRPGKFKTYFRHI